MYLGKVKNTEDFGPSTAIVTDLMATSMASSMASKLVLNKFGYRGPEYTQTTQPVEARRRNNTSFCS